MWPFIGGLLSSIEFTLRVPGQDSQDSFFATDSHPFTTRLRIRFNAGTGNFEYRRNLNSWQQFNDPNTWIHADTKDPNVFDSSLYEVRLINMTGDTSRLTGDVWFGPSFGAEDGWIDLDTHTEWLLTNSDGDWEQYEVEGLVSIREKLDIANLVVGSIKMTAFRDGPS